MSSSDEAVDEIRMIPRKAVGSVMGPLKTPRDSCETGDNKIKSLKKSERSLAKVNY